MKKNLILLLLITLVGCSSFEQTSQKSKEVSSEKLAINTDNKDVYIKAAHYFGDEWPINFWSSELNNIDKDFNKIKDDGFNSIVLVIPWGEFQPKITPIEYNDEVFNRLKNIIEKADRQKLNVILRIGYAWDFDPEVQLPNVERLRALYTDEQVYKAWLAYIEKIREVTLGYENVNFAFLTWEDFWGIVEEASHLKTLNQRTKLSEEIKFPAYLKKEYTLKQLSEIYGYEISSWETIPIPEKETEAFKLFYQYIDELLIEKFFNPAKERFPNLSMEVRVDSDPIILKNKQIEWYSHKETFTLPNSEYTTTYYSPAMGAMNNNNEESASKSLKRQELLFKDVKTSSGGNKVFVDQFLYYDNTPNFISNTKIKSNELNDFIIRSADNLKKHTNGYGVWTYKDYAANTVYNPQFEFGMKGWEVKGADAEIVNNKDDNAVLLKTGGIVTQSIVKDRDFYHASSKTTHLRFNAKSLKRPINLLIKIGNLSFNMEIGSSNKEYKIDIPINQLNDYTLSFESKEGDVVIDDIKLYSFVQEAKIYKLNGKGDTALNAIRSLNNLIPDYIEDYAIKEFDTNSNSKLIKNESTHVYKNSYPIEGEYNNRYVWVPKLSQITLLANSESKAINIKGVIPFDLHKKVYTDLKSINISYYINGKRIKESSYTKESEFNEIIDLNEIKNLIESNERIKLDIEISSEVNPERDGIGPDKRNLAIMINNIKVE